MATYKLRQRPNQSGWHTKYLYRARRKKTRAVVEARILHQMPFLTQPSPFQGLGLAPPMALITVEAGNRWKWILHAKWRWCRVNQVDNVGKLTKPYLQLLECWWKLRLREVLNCLHSDTDSKRDIFTLLSIQLCQQRSINVISILKLLR
jgi:hypothetical protein